MRRREVADRGARPHAAAAAAQAGQVERRSHDYQRHGTLSLFAALDVAAGKVVGRCFPRHGASEFRKFLDIVEASVPAHLDVHLVMDNVATATALGSRAPSTRSMSRKLIS